MEILYLISLPQKNSEPNKINKENGSKKSQRKGYAPHT